MRASIRQLLRDQHDLDDDSSECSALFESLRRVVDEEDDVLDENQDLIFDILPNGMTGDGDSSLGDGDSRASHQMKADADEVWRIITADQSIKISEWEQLGTVKSVGSVHSGKIFLCVVENDDGRRMLVDGNIKSIYLGGQIYMPMTKKIMHDQDFIQNKVIPTLPAIIMNLCVNQRTVGSASVPAMIEKAKFSVKKLKDFHKHAFYELGTKHRSSCVRYEMFIPVDPKDTGFFQESDAEYVQSWMVSKHGHLPYQHGKMLEELIEPLHRVLEEQDLGRELWQFSEPTKAMLLLCAEMTIKLAGFHPFEGRLTKQLMPAVTFDGTVHRLRIPIDILEEISKKEYEKTGLKCGLNTELLEITLDPSTERPKETDRKGDYMKLPPFIQMYQRLLDIGVNEPTLFLRYNVKLCILCWTTIDRRQRSYAYLEDYYKLKVQEDIGFQVSVDGSDMDFHPPKRSIFQRPDFKELANCTAQQLSSLMEEFAKVIATAYDAEWYFIHKKMMWKHNQKYNKGKAPPPLKLATFPTTEDEMKAFVQACNRHSRRQGRGATKYQTRETYWAPQNIGNVVKTVGQFERYICYSMDPGALGPNWKRSLTRNLLRNVQDMRRQVSKALPAEPDSIATDRMVAAVQGAINQPQGKADILSDKNFRHVLLRVFQSEWRRRNPADTSRAIIWHSINTQYAKAKETSAELFVFQPMILDIKEGLPPNNNNANIALMQQQLQYEAVQEPIDRYPYQNRTICRSKRQAVFMIGIIDILSIIRTRLLLYMAVLQGEFAPLADWFQRLEHVNLTDSTRMSDFSRDHRESQRKFSYEYTMRQPNFPTEGRWQDWYKFYLDHPNPTDNTYNIYKAALYNFSCWECNAGDFKPESLFSFSSEQEEEARNADMYLQSGQIHHVRCRFVIKGAITPKFIDALRVIWHNICEKSPEKSPTAKPAIATAGKRKRRGENGFQGGPDAGAGN